MFLNLKVTTITIIPATVKARVRNKLNLLQRLINQMKHKKQLETEQRIYSVVFIMGKRTGIYLFNLFNIYFLFRSYSSLQQRKIKN